MKKLIVLFSLIASCAFAQEVRVTLTAEQYAAVNAVVLSHNAVVTVFNADTNNISAMTNITCADVLRRYADRLVNIAQQNRKTAVVAAFDRAPELQKAKIEAEAAKAVAEPKEK